MITTKLHQILKSNQFKAITQKCYYSKKNKKIHIKTRDMDTLFNEVADLGNFTGKGSIAGVFL